MSLEQSTYNALLLVFQHGFFYVVPGAFVASLIYRIRS